MSDEQVYRCPECGNTATVSPKTDYISVMLSCSDGHDIADMYEVRDDEQ